MLNSKEMLVELIGKKTSKIRKYVQMIDMVLARCPGGDYRMFHCKMLEKAKTEALELSGMNYDKIINIPNYVSDDLN